MKYSAKISIHEDIEILSEAFLEEIGEKDRSRIIMKKKDNALEFEIESSDSVALRSSLNTITKLLSVYEKTKGIVNDK